MSLTLPPVGTSHLLELLSPYVSDDFIAEVCPQRGPGGRRHDLSAARLWRTLPTARMLHEFRGRVGVSGLRAINRHLVGRLARRQGVQPHAVALMDATDLPAAWLGR